MKNGQESRNIWSPVKKKIDELDRSSIFLALLIVTIAFSFILYVLLFAAPSGTDVYTHMYNTQRMANSNSLNEFYQKSVEEEYLEYDYPFGLWYFGSIAMKLTGLNIYVIAFLIPLFLMAGTLIVYYCYAFDFLRSKEQSILAILFFISMPMITLALINYSTSVFVTSFLILILYLAFRPAGWINYILILILVFTLCFTHTGTFLFLLSFAVIYFLLRTLIWDRIEENFYFMIVAMLFCYTAIVQIFPFVQPQYIDKGTLITSTTLAISSALHTDIIQNAGQIFYNTVFVSNNFIFAFLWSAMIFATAKALQYCRKYIENLYAGKASPAALPFIGSIEHVSKGIIAAPFWVGPVQSLLSLIGIFKIDDRGKCFALTLIITAVIPGSLAVEQTGSLREISYLLILIPIISVLGFYVILPRIDAFAQSPSKRIIAIILYLIIFVPLIAAPVIGCLHYQPTLTMTPEEKTDLTWLSTIGNPTEGADGSAYLERMTLYANKTIPSVPRGKASAQYLSDLYNTFFSTEPDGSTRDLSASYQVKYLISSNRTMKQYNESNDTLTIDANRQVDKIYSSGVFFGIYSILSGHQTTTTTIQEPVTWNENTAGTKVQSVGPVFLVENDYYKVKLSDTTPAITYIGSKTGNMLGEGEYSDTITLIWTSPNDTASTAYSVDLRDLQYQSIEHSDNTLVYKAMVTGANDTPYLAALTVKYTFYEQAFRREITIANDGVDADRAPALTAIVSSTLFAPIDSFEFLRTSPEEPGWVNKKIYTAEDWAAFKEAPFNSLYFAEKSSGIYKYYDTTAPYPTKLQYLGTDYNYGAVYMEDSTYELQASEPVTVTEYYAVGTKLTAMESVERYTSVSRYDYQKGQIPLIVIGSPEAYNGSLTTSALALLDKYKIPYVQEVSGNSTGITKTSAGSSINRIGSLTVVSNNTYMSAVEQGKLIRDLQAKSIKGAIVPSFVYNFNTVRLLNDNNLLDAAIIPTAPVYEYMYQQGSRQLKYATVNGNETGLVLVPVTFPGSALLSSYSPDEIFSRWNDTIDYIQENGGVVAFVWDLNDIANPEYLQKMNRVLARASERKLTPTTPDSVADFYRKLDNISVTVQKGEDYVILDAVNPSAAAISGVTYKVMLPTISEGCPYTVYNGTLSRYIAGNESCSLYVSFDLKGRGTNKVIVQPNVVKETFVVNIPTLYEGENSFVVLDSRNIPVPGANVIVGPTYYQTDSNGKVTIIVTQGMNTIQIQKAGYNTTTINSNVKPRIFRYLPIKS